MSVHQAIEDSTDVEHARSWSFYSGASPCSEPASREQSPVRKPAKKSFWRKKSSLDIDGCVREYKLRQLTDELRQMKSPQEKKSSGCDDRKRKNSKEQTAVRCGSHVGPKDRTSAGALSQGEELSLCEQEQA